MKSKPTYEQLVKRLETMEKKLAGCKNRNGKARLSTQYLEAIINNTNLPIYLKDADYNYILVNHQFERLTQITNDQIQGRDDYAFFPEPVAKLFRSQDEEVVQRRSLVEFVETIPLPDGVHTFLTAKFPLIDNKGRTYAVGGVCTDITAHKKVEEELREAEEKFRGIFEHSPLGIVHIDREGIVTACNEKLAEILGSAIEKIVGIDTLKSLKVDKMRETIIKALSGAITHYEGKYTSVTGGKERDIYSVFSPVLSSDGSITGIIGICEDITRRKQTEKELRQAHDELERRVAERTAQVERKRKTLEETNIALKILLEKREEDKIEFEEKVMFNIEKLIYPFLEKLKSKCSENSQQAILAIIRANLEEITSSFAHNHKDHLAKLTPTQLQIATLIKQGQTTKKIAALMNLSPLTVACHRQEIRKKLSLTNKKINLQASLAVTQ